MTSSGPLLIGSIDIAQAVLYAFWIFFAGLIFYLRREDHREGYPLVNEDGRAVSPGFPSMPAPKYFRLAHGGTAQAPRTETPRTFALAPTAPWPGAPMTPTGNPLVDGVGPASYALRANEPHLMHVDDKPSIQPMRIAAGYTLAPEDPNPIGMTVLDADGMVAATITDVWIDRAEALVRFLECEVPGGTRRLIPMPLVKIDEGRRFVTVRVLTARQFLDAPILANPDQVTLREEDRIQAYFAGGQLYAKADRLGPLL